MDVNFVCLEAMQSDCTLLSVVCLSLVQTYFIPSLLYNRQSANNITKQLNERDLTVSVSLYKSSPERWYDVLYNKCY